MSYTALYRKWRPERFQDVKGQDAIVTTLKNQIIRDRIGHAYLFCGTRGTGKTTIAKIIAKAVNCENPVDGSPCGKCRSCIAVTEGSSMNVIEIDAASNRGVDNIRTIRDEVTYAPTEGRYKVYIIDEVHMLTIEAFNALLKTLEEPPAYVIFILATTEVHKIPVTILSRCQRYDFKRIPVDTIVERLHELMEGEGIRAEEKALRYIARIADGGLRDALSLFDQCSSFYYDQELTYDKVLDALGAVDTEVLSDLLCAVITKDIKGAVGILDEAVAKGRELNQFVIDFTWYLRNLMLIKTAEDDEMDEVIDISSENMEELRREAAAVDLNRIMRYIRVFSELSNEIKYATQKRVLIEIAIIKLCKPEMEMDTESVLDRIRSIEDKLESGVYLNRQDNEGRSVSAEEEYVEPMKLERALSDDLKKVIGSWQRVLAELPKLGHGYLKKCRLSVSDEDRLTIALFDDTAYEYMSTDTAREELSAALDLVAGRKVEFDIVCMDSRNDFNRKYPDLSIINMEIEEEDQ